MVKIENEELWRKAIKNEDSYALCSQLFDVELYEGQQDIVEEISFDGSKRLSVLTPSQYGKTWSIAAALGLYVLLHEEKNILIVSGTQNQARIMRDKFAEFLAKCEPLADLVDTNASGVDRLKKEASKKRITFKNGCEIRTLTAGGNNDAESLMGFGADLVVLDESNLISDAIYEKRILRMLGNSSDSSLVQIGNPTTRNHFYESIKKKESHDVIHIDHKQAVSEGSFTQAYVDEMRNEMSERAFRINIMAEFPEADESNTLMKWSWLEKANHTVFEWGSESSDRVMYGLDVARQGDDSSVLTRVEVKNGEYRVTDQWKWDVNDTTQLVRNVEKIMDARDEDHVNVDTHGIGAGVLDQLRDDGYYAVGIKVGKGAEDKDMFLRQKAEHFWKLRGIAEDEDLCISIDESKELLKELDDIDIEYNAREKIKIVDPDGYSPDRADSLMLALSFERGKSDWGVGSSGPVI